MSVVHNIFCPECDSILDISRTVTTKKIVNLDDTPSSVSEEDDNKMEKIVIKLLGTKDSSEVLENIDVERVINSESYKKLDKDKKKIINDKIEKFSGKMGDFNMFSYYYCNSCSWSQKIKPGDQILSKTGENTQGSYININRFKNKIHSKILPFTRNYICPNKECPGNKDKEKHEAVMYRVNDTLKIMYTCCACQEIFSSQ